MTKKSTLGIMLVGVLAFAGPVAAQKPAESEESARGSGMMMQGQNDGGMMQGMMGGGMDQGMQGRGMMMGGSDGGMMGGMCAMMGGDMMNGMGHNMMMSPGMKGAANLSEEQQQKLADLHAEQARKQFLLMQKMQAPRQRLHELMKAEELDVQAISQTYDKLAELRKEALINRVEARQQMQQVVGQQQHAMGQTQRPDMNQ